MANVEINDLTEKATPASTDEIEMQETGGGDSKKATLANVLATSHNHAASEVTSGTLAHERGGLEADASAYNGLVKISGGASSAVTAPSGAVVGDSDTQTLTNKTLTTPTIASLTNAQHDHEDAAGGGSLAAAAIGSGTLADARVAESNVTQHEAALSIGGAQITLQTTQTLTDQATISWDVSSGPVAKVTLAGNRTMAAPTNLVDGGTYILRVIQDGTGSRTITWNAIFKWAGGTAPTLSTGAAAIDVLTFVSDGTNLYGASQLDYS